MNWIRIAVEINDDPKVHGLAKALKVRVPEAVGLVVGVLRKLPAHARDGSIAAVSDESLALWSGWHGTAAKFGAAFREAMCVDGAVAGWLKHNGTAIKENDEARERMRAKRQSVRRTEGERSSNVPPTVPRTFGSDGTGRDETNYSSTVKAAAVVGSVDPGSSGDVVGLLAPDAASIYASLRRGHRAPDAFDAMVRSAVEPITGGVQFTWAEASSAIVQLRGSGREVTAKLLRAFMADARKRPDSTSDRPRLEADPWFERSQELSKLRAQNEYLIDDCRQGECVPEPEWAAEADCRYPRSPRMVA